MKTLNAIEQALGVAQRLAEEAGTESDREAVAAATEALAALDTDPFEWEDEDDYNAWFSRYFRPDYLSDQEFADLRTTLERLALEIGGIDEDGDRRVQVIALQRNQHHFMHFQPEPQSTMRSLTEAELLERWRLASMNHGIVTDQMRRLDFDMRETLGGEGE